VRRLNFAETSIKRRITRARKIGNIESIDRIDFKEARKELRKAIRTAKKKTWTELIATRRGFMG